jgi:hypothetical protein
VAALNKGQAATYTLQSSASDRSGENSTLIMQTEGDHLEIGNNKFSIRVPKIQSKTLPSPVSLHEAPRPRGPILELEGRGNRH